MIKEINIAPNAQLLKHTRPCEKALLSGVLEAEGTKITVWNSETVKHIQDLKDTAENYPTCIGLASNQIWDDESKLPLSVFIIKIPHDEDKHTWQEFINPKIKTTGKTIKFNENCLSVPKPKKPAKRESNVIIEYCTLETGYPIQEKFFLKDSLLPIVIQHEYDHLIGKIIK